MNTSKCHYSAEALENNKEKNKKKREREKEKETKRARAKVLNNAGNISTGLAKAHRTYMQQTRNSEANPAQNSSRKNATGAGRGRRASDTSDCY